MKGGVIISNTESELVYTSCSHEESHYDRFGDEVCTSCYAVLKSGVVPPSPGLESASSYDKAS
jgi:hypothetical protein